MNETLILSLILLYSFILCTNGQNEGTNKEMDINVEDEKVPRWIALYQAGKKIIKKLTTGDIYKGKGVKENKASDDEEDKPLKSTQNEQEPPKNDFIKPGDIIKGQYKKAFDTTGGDFNSFYDNFRKERLKGFRKCSNCPKMYPPNMQPNSMPSTNQRRASINRDGINTLEHAQLSLE